MRQTKVVFIIPGFRQKPTQIAYKEIAKKLKSEGYFPVPITINWKETTISENTDYFLSQVKKRDLVNKKIYILGFSYGAMIAFLAATKIKVHGLILCSLSPFFKEDLQKLSKSATALEIKRYMNFSILPAKELARKVKAKNVCM